MWDDEQPGGFAPHPVDDADAPHVFDAAAQAPSPAPEAARPHASVPAGSRVVLIVSRGPSPAAPAIPVSMPGVLGEPQGRGLIRLQDIGLSIHVLHDHHDRLPKGYVVGQYPSAGERVQPGSDGVLVVSSGRAQLPAPPVALPSVVGLEHNVAAERVLAAGLAPRVVYDHDPVAPPGVVLAQLPSPSSLGTPVRKRAGVGWIASLVALFAIALLAGVVWYFNRPATVPNVVGMSQAQAEQTVRLAGFSVGSVASSQTPNPSDVGKIVEQSPGPGITAPNGSSVSLVVAGGQLLVSVPNVTGAVESQAIKGLQDAQLVFNITLAYSATIPSGAVIAQAPAAGQRVPAGTTVGLTLSMGQQMVSMPNVLQQQKESAIVTLRASGLVPQVVSNYETTTPAGQVMLQSPMTGTPMAPGSIVGLVVSRGVPASGTPVAVVPKGVGKTSAKAAKLMKAAKLKSIAMLRDRTGLPRGTVVQQLPDVNAIVPKGSWIILFVSSGR